MIWQSRIGDFVFFVDESLLKSGLKSGLNKLTNAISDRLAMFSSVTASRVLISILAALHPRRMKSRGDLCKLTLHKTLILYQFN